MDKIKNLSRNLIKTMRTPRMKKKKKPRAKKHVAHRLIRLMYSQTLKHNNGPKSKADLEKVIPLLESMTTILAGQIQSHEDMTKVELTSMNKRDSTALKENYDKQIKVLKISSNAVTELKELKKRFHEVQEEQCISYVEVPDNDEVIIDFMTKL